MTTHVLIGSANDLSPAHYIIGLTKIPFRGGGASWNVVGGGGGRFLPTNPYENPYTNFPKRALRCSLAQAIFTVFSVSVIDAMHQ